MPDAFFSRGMRVGLHSVSEVEIYESFGSSFFDVVGRGGSIILPKNLTCFVDNLSRCCFLKNNNNKICVFIFTC